LPKVEIRNQKKKKKKVEEKRSFHYIGQECGGDNFGPRILRNAAWYQRYRWKCNPLKDVEKVGSISFTRLSAP
jgi:hypothetical protein